jgi:hypothetical protein
VVKKVLEKRPMKAITVYVDMKDVDRAAKVCAHHFEGAIICNFLLCYRKVYLETLRMKAMEGSLM